MSVIEALTRMRDDCLFPQNFIVYVAKTSTEDKKSSKLPTKVGNQSPRHSPRVSGESSRKRFTPRRAASKVSRDSTSYQSKSGNDSSKTPPTQLPSQVQNSGGVSTAKATVEEKTHSSKLVSPNSKRTKEVSTFIESQSTNLKLTPDERNMIITTILETELGLRSKLDAQMKEIFSSPRSDDIVRRTTPSKATHPERNEPLFHEKQTQLKSIPTQAIIFPSDRSRPTSVNDRQSKQSKYKRNLTPIPEVSEETLRGVESRVQNEGQHEKVENLEALKAQERLRQQNMESDLHNNLIQDTDVSLVRSSEESDSLDELVIKEFAIRIAPSEPDASISTLPITDQAIKESEKLATAIDSLKERFQVKIARDKSSAQPKQKIQIPEVKTVTNRNPSTPPTEGTTIQRGTNRYVDSLQKYFKPDAKANSTTKSTPPINIIDSKNWGEAVLPKPIFPHRNTSEPEEIIHASSSEESFLNEKDMQFDDLFGMDSVSTPLISSQQTQPQLQQNKSPQQTEKNIEDFENPHLSDLPSDESDQIEEQTTARRFNGMNVSVDENIENFEEPELYSETSSDEIVTASSTPPNNATKNQVVYEHPQHKVISASEVQHRNDVKRLKELLDDGALATLITDQYFEEGVLDLLLRQSDSLWDPVVSGIPLAYFIPSRNHEKGLLDTSINEFNLDQPLIQSPQKKLPEYLESLENEWAAKTANIIDVDIYGEKNLEDESQLIHNLPEFSYEPVPQYLFRRSIHNIMDSEDEPEDSDQILEDEEMNFDDLIDNYAAPNYDFNKAKLLDALEWKIKFLRELKGNCEQTKKPASSVNSHKVSRNPNLKQLESELGPREVFNNNHDLYNVLFAIDKTEPTRDNYVINIESLHDELPSIENRIIRNVNNCQRHLVLMKSIYKNINKHMSQRGQPQSSKTDEKLEEIIKIFNQVKDGRICARIQSCPEQNSFQSTKSHDSSMKNDELLRNKTAQASEIQRGSIKEQEEVNTRNPVKIRKVVSFSEDVPTSNTSKTGKRKAASSTKPSCTGTTGHKKIEHEKSVRQSRKAQKKTVHSETSGVDNSDFNEWTSLNISEVKDLIEQARLAQARYKDSNTVRTNRRTVKP